MRYKDKSKLKSIDIDVPRIYCKCGHSLTDVLTNYNYVTCSWCGRLVFKNKKAEFDYRLSLARKKESKL